MGFVQFCSLTLFSVSLPADWCRGGPACVWLTWLNPWCNGKQIMACAAWWVEGGIISMFIHLFEEMCVCVWHFSEFTLLLLPSFLICWMSPVLLFSLYASVSLRMCSSSPCLHIQLLLSRESSVCIYEKLLEASPPESSVLGVDMICQWLKWSHTHSYYVGLLSLSSMPGLLTLTSDLEVRQLWHYKQHLGRCVCQSHWLADTHWCAAKVKCVITDGVWRESFVQFWLVLLIHLSFLSIWRIFSYQQMATANGFLKYRND